MTDFALLRCRETRQVPARRFLVARDALQLQRRVRFVIKRLWFAGPVQRYGKENATNESEYLSLNLFPPPAAITAYCFLFFFDTKRSCLRFQPSDEGRDCDRYQRRDRAWQD